MQPLIRVLLLSAAACLFGCGDDDDDIIGADGDVDADGDTDGDAQWTVTDVDTDDAASQPSLDVSDSGEVGIAYFTIHNYQDGTMCPEGDPPGPQNKWKLRFAHGTPETGMAVEEVDSPFFVIETRGTTLRYQGDTANIVSMSGAIEPTRLEYCGANDLYRFTRNADGSWASVVVVANSGEAPATDECVAASASTYGWVVGVWPALAFGTGGEVATAWRDIHAGATLQRDDLARSDLEFNMNGTFESIDCGGAAGDYTTLAFEPSGGLVASWYTDIRAGAGEQAREGVWLARRAQPSWEKYRLFQGESGPRTSMAVAPDGTIGVVWYQDQALKYGWVAPGQPVNTARIETASPVNMNAGMHASIAYTADSVPVVSHYRCNRYLPDEAGCDPVEDGPQWSWREDNNGTGVWKTEAVEPPDEFTCGDQTQIGVRPDGSIVMIYSCQVYHFETQTFTSTLKMASRPHL